MPERKRNLRPVREVTAPTLQFRTDWQPTDFDELLKMVITVVPEGVEVVMNGTGVLGRQRGGTMRWLPQDGDHPVVEVRGYVVASEVLVRTPPRQRRWLPRWRRAPLT